MICLAMPGKFGDALFSWPLARHLWRTTGERLTFVTSAYCAGLERLCLAQRWCGGFHIPPDYQIVNMGCGCQPPWMPMPAGTTKEYQCGFTTTPTCNLTDFMASQHGLPAGLPIEYDVPTDFVMTQPYIVLAARGQTTFRELFAAFVDACPIQVIEVGGRGDRCSEKSMDCTGMDFLLTAGIMSKAKAFVGLMSSQLVLANGFAMPRIAVWDGQSWDMRHVLRSQWNHYPANPTTDELLRLCGVR